MKLIMENWRRFIKEDTRAFHGWGMDPTKMRVNPGCDGGKPQAANPDNQWAADDEGCPRFSDDKNIDAQHEDIIEAISFLENVKPQTLIAYSRGGAVAASALQNAQHRPEIKFVAPAWKRDWVSGNPTPPQGLEGTIVHGSKDNAVPLRHSFELAKETGLPLYVAMGANHINVLKLKDDPTQGIEVSSDILKAGLESLPEWESNKGGEDEQIEAQHKFMEKFAK